MRWPTGWQCTGFNAAQDYPSRPLNAVRRELDPTCSARAPEYETAGLCSPSGCPLKLNALPADAFDARTHTNTPQKPLPPPVRPAAQKGTPRCRSSAPCTHLPRPSTTFSSQTRSSILRRRAKPRAKSLKPSRLPRFYQRQPALLWINGRRGPRRAPSHNFAPTPAGIPMKRRARASRRKAWTARRRPACWGIRAIFPAVSPATPKLSAGR